MIKHDGLFIVLAINLAKTCTVSFWLTVAVHRLLAYEADQVELVYA